MKYSPLRFLPRMFFRGQTPIHLTYFITNKCNAKCSYCFYSSELNISKSLLSLEEAETLAGSFGNLLWLLLSGGEPFLRPDIEKICDIFYRRNKPSFIVIPTNGLNPSIIEEKVKLIAKKCIRSQIVIKVSIDGWESDHDTLRGVPGNFERVKQTISRLQKLRREYSNLEVGINTVFLRKNQKKAFDLYSQVKKNWPDLYHGFSLERGNETSLQDSLGSVEAYKSLFGKILEAGRTGLKTQYRFFMGSYKFAQIALEKKIIYKTLTAGRRQIPCFAGTLSLVVSETGDIYPCEVLPEKMGSLREKNFNFSELIRSEKAITVKNKIRAGNPVCDKCTHECNLGINMFFNKKTALQIGWMGLKNVFGG